MMIAGLTGLRAYGPNAAAFVAIALLAGLLVERRILTPRLGAAALTLTASPPVARDDSPPVLRRIVLDPCTGLEKPPVSAANAKAD